MTIARRVRAYFAPVDRGSNTPTIFDPAQKFEGDNPTWPWIAAGEIRNFKRTLSTKFGTITAGAKGAATGQFRSELEARVAFDFCTWGKLQMAIAGGSQHINVL